MPEDIRHAMWRTIFARRQRVGIAYGFWVGFDAHVSEINFSFSNGPGDVKSRVEAADSPVQQVSTVIVGPL
jgi:hypothetical protein